ncbi:MAG: hypothetical protein ACM3S5_01665 [Rhodospirillales bacterium]
MGGRKKNDVSETPAADGISPGQVREQLQRILSSERFVNSDRLRRFLQYIVETLRGSPGSLKEYSLGVAVFDRDASYDPRTDPIVRVEAGRLRSRLNEYYNSRGRDDPIIIELPKGSYAVTVHLRSAPEAGRFNWTRRLRWMLDLRFAGFAAMSVLCAVLALQNRSLRATGGVRLPREAEPIWGPLLSSQAETVIIFGSPLFFESEDKRLYVRGYDINDPFDRFRNPAYLGLEKLLGPLSEPRYVYVATGDALALHLLGDYLGRYGKRTKALPANLATWDAIKDKNIVCVGARRMIPLLERLPVQLDFVLQPDFYVLNLKPGRERKNPIGRPHTGTR